MKAWPGARGTRAPRLSGRERVLAWCEATDPQGTLLVGTRDAFVVLVDGVEQVRVAWHEVQAADWDRDDSVLSLAEVGTWGEPRPQHRWTVEEPRRLIELIRERVTTTVVLQRHTPVHGRKGLRVVARRATSGERRIRWFYEYDEGVDPDDPEVRRVAGEALAQAQEEVGPG